MSVKRKDLVDIGDPNYHQRLGEIMFCRYCDQELGGTRGDFWELDMEKELICPYCEGELNLVKKVYKYVPIKKGMAT